MEEFVINGNTYTDEGKTFCRYDTNSTAKSVYGSFFRKERQTKYGG